MEKKRKGSTGLRDIRQESLARLVEKRTIDRLPPMGGEEFALDLAGLSMRFTGASAPLRDAFLERFGPFCAAPGDVAGPLAVSLHQDRAAYYVEKRKGDSEGYYRLRIHHEPGLIRMVTYSMAAWIDLEGSEAGIAFGTGDFDPPERALENFCRAAAAWQAVRMGGFLIHGASIIRNGRGYIFFGKSAAGKSTLASMTPEGRVVSDDLTLVLPGEGGLEVAGSPFRGTFREGEPVVGRFPLAGIFRIYQADSVHAEDPGRIRGLAELMANLPFVNDAFHHYPGLMDQIESAAAQAPILFLHFEKKPTYWPEVDRALGDG